MSQLTEIERNDLDKICAVPLDRFKRRMKWHAFYAFGGFALLVVGLIWLKTFRAPTVTQAMVFSGFVALSSSIGYCITSLLNFRYIRIIQFLNDELRSMRGEDGSETNIEQ